MNESSEKTRVLLVYAASEINLTATNTYSAPLGLLSMATHAKKALGDSLEIKILDGSMISQEKQMTITTEFEPHVTGISSTIGSQSNAYEIAEKAKDLGSLVLFGGVHSSATWDEGRRGMWKNMLTNRDFIDAVVLYDGEEAFTEILRRFNGSDKTFFDKIPNVAYRSNQEKVIPPCSIKIPSLEDIPDIDYSLFDMERFLKRNEKIGFGRATTYYGGKGCSKRGNIKLKESYEFDEYQELTRSMNTCSFCGRNELGLRNVGEDREARIVRELHDKFGVTTFFNVQDTVNLKYTKPIGLNDSLFRLFIGTESVTPKNIKLLQQRYGHNLIFQIGIEASSPEMRTVYGKTSTNNDRLVEQINMLREEGIQVHPSFILGGRGETEYSIKQTADTFKRLSEYDNVTWALVSPQLILPGSPDFNALMQMPLMNRKYSQEDQIDIVKIHKDFLRKFAPSLTREMIIETIKNTFEHVRGYNRKDLVLDVKGITLEEEKYVNPLRPYANQH